MKKMMKLFHDTELLGNIEFLGVDGSDMLGHISLTPEGEKFKEMFASLCDESKAHLEPPYPDSLLEEGWAIEDHEGIMREIIGCPAVLDNFTSIAWRWA
jgi:hypothetical protein